MFKTGKGITVGTLHSVLLGLILLWSVFSPMQEFITFRIIAGLFLIWLTTSLMVKSSFFINCVRGNIIFFIFYFILFLRVILVDNKELSSEYFSSRFLLGQFALPFILFCSYIYCKEKSIGFKRKLTKILLTAYTISSAITLYYLSKDKYVLRDGFPDQYFAIANHDFVYTSIMIAGLILCHLVTSKKFNLWYIIAFVIISLLPLTANYTTALILYFAFIGYIFLTLVAKKNSYIVAILLMCIVFFLVVFNDQIANGIYFFAINSGLADVVQVRLVEISDLMLNDLNQNSDLGVRNQLQAKSLNTFLENPLLGVNYDNYNSSTIGKHAQWTDNLAQFGVVGNILLVSYFMYIYRYTKKFTTSVIERYYINLSWFFFIVFGILNPNMRFTFFLTMLILAPFMSTLDKKKRIPNKQVA